MLNQRTFVSTSSLLHRTLIGGARRGRHHGIFARMSRRGKKLSSLSSLSSMSSLMSSSSSPFDSKTTTTAANMTTNDKKRFHSTSSTSAALENLKESYENIIVDVQKDDKVATITLNRQKAIKCIKRRIITRFITCHEGIK